MCGTVTLSCCDAPILLLRHAISRARLLRRALEQCGRARAVGRTRRQVTRIVVLVLKVVLKVVLLEARRLSAHAEERRGGGSVGGVGSVGAALAVKHHRAELVQRLWREMTRGASGAVVFTTSM